MNYTITRYAKGTIWWCNLSEDNMLSYMQKGRRPVLIISNSETNEIEHACTILPISTAEKYDNYLDTHQVVKYTYNDLTSYIMCNMPRRISVFKLDRYYGTLSDELFNKVMTNYLYYFDCANPNMTNKTTSLSDTIAEILRFVSTTKTNTIPTNTEISVPKTVAETTETIVDKPVKTAEKIIGSYIIKDKTTKTDSYKRPYKRKFDKFSDTTKKTENVSVPKVPQNLDKKERRKSAVEHGYWSIKENNIEFWNEILIGDIESIIKKYKYNNKTDVSRRKYRVKQFLLDWGYTLEDLKTFIEK